MGDQNNTDPKNAFGQELWKLRMARGWSQEKLAEIAYVSHDSVGRYERAEAAPKSEFVSSVATALGLDKTENASLEAAAKLTRKAFADNKGKRRKGGGELPSKTKSELTPADESDLKEIPSLLRVGGASSVYSYEQKAPPEGPFIPRPDFDEIRDLLLAEDSHIRIAITGRPGVGKGELANRLVWDDGVRKAYSDNIIRINLGKRPDVLGALAELGKVLGSEVSDIPSIEGRVERVRKQLALRPYLLVISTVWHLETATLFGSLLPRAIMLVTRSYDIVERFTRRENVFELKELAPDQALRYLQELAPDAAELEELGEVVQLTGALPWTLRHIAPELNKRARAGVGLERFFEKLKNPSWRAATLDDVVGTWLSEIPADLYAAFLQLAVFGARPADFDAAAAAAVWDVGIEVAEDRLVEFVNDLSLVRSPQMARFMLHQSLADTAIAKLPNPEVYRRRHALHYLNMVKRDTGDIDTIASELAQIRNAWQAAQGEPDLVLEFVDALQIYQERCGLFEEKIAWVESGVAVARRLGRQYKVDELFVHIGWAKARLGLHAEGLKYLRTAYESQATRGDSGEASNTLLRMGEVYMLAQEISQAEVLFSQAERESAERESDITENMRNKLSREVSLAWAHLHRGRWEPALRSVASVLRAANEVGDRLHIADGLILRSYAYRKLGYLPEADEDLVNAHAIIKDYRDEPREGRCLYHLARVYIEQGQFQDALHAFERTASFLEKAEADQYKLMAATKCGIGILRLTTGNRTEVQELLEEGLQLARQHKQRRYAALSRIAMVVNGLPEFAQPFAALMLLQLRHWYMKAQARVRRGTLGSSKLQELGVSSMEANGIGMARSHRLEGDQNGKD